VDGMGTRFRNRPTVLLVDQDERYCQDLQSFLVENGYDVSLEHNGSQALNRITAESPDLVLMEIDLPGENGLTICKLSRRHYHGKILFLSDRDAELDEVLGLDMGADDFISKRASNRLILARLNARNRTDANIDSTKENENRLTFGSLVIDKTMREAWLNDDAIELTSAEFDLLWLLSSHAGEILTREDIFHELRGIEYDGQDRSVDVRVSRIRPKVGDDPIHPKRIKTVRSKGYLFVSEVTDIHGHAAPH
jgi:two-component system, OmpR family, response regulator RstA